MTKVDVNAISTEEWHSIQKEMWIAAFQMAVMALVDLGGSESAINQLKPYMRMSAHAFSINMIKRFNIQGDDLERIGVICDLFEKFFEYDLKEIERTQEMIVRVGGPQCPWRSNTQEGCITGHEMFFNEICQVVNPEYECRFMQMIPKGDPVCSWIIQKKKK